MNRISLMRLKTITSQALAALLLAPLAALPAADAPAKKPNILVILADDLGHADLGCQGSKEVVSPQIDSIAANGVRFTAGYVSAPQCCPSRAGLITGRYQNRFGFEANWPASATSLAGLPTGEQTIADHLKAAGYVTGMIGKWHLGDRDAQRPYQRGFDETFWHPNGGVLFPDKKSGFINNLYRGSILVQVADYSTDAFGREAVEFIERHQHTPFFLYLAFVPPHWPMQAKPEHLNHFAHIPDLHRRTMLAMMASLDENVGRVLSKLRETKLEDNTLVFFLSDNGGPTGRARPQPDADFEYGQNTSRNDPCRGVKGDLLEGGIRVPFMVQWKGRIPAGKTYDQPVISLDILPTALAAAGVESQAAWKLEGANLLPFLTGENPETPHDTLYWRFRFPPAQPAQYRWAIRQGDWKLVKNGMEPVSLYDLASDIGETTNLADEHPGRVAALKAEYDKWDAQNREPLWADAPAPPAEAQPVVEWVTREVKAPRVSFHTFESAAAKGKVSYHLYTPEVYDSIESKDRRFPVVYWLHGSGGGLTGIPQIARHFDAAIEAGKTPPFLVVFVNGLVEGMYVDWKDGTVPLETVIVSDLVPHIDASYRTLATRKGRMLDGFSMGGYGAARLGFKHTNLFRAVSIVGAGPMQAELSQAPRAGRKRAAEVLQKVYGGDQEYFRSVSPRRLAEQNAASITDGSLVRMVIGDKDETFAANRDFHEHLDRLEVPHTWKVLPGVAHDPMGVLTAMGDENWAFYRAAFGEPSSVKPTASKADTVVTFKIKDQDRRAVVVNAPADAIKRPAVLVLHGGMGSAEVMRANSGFDTIARANGFMVVYAEGTAFGGDRHAWNTGFLLRRQVRDADEIAYFDTLIDTIVRDHAADPTRICMTGGSNGGMMTFVYAVARPQRLAAIAPVVASMFTFDTVPAVPLPIVIINGARDEEVPLEGGMSRNPIVRRAQEAPFKPLKDVVQFWVAANRSKAQPTVVTTGTVTTTTYEVTPEGAVTEFVVDAAGGHGWPGSRSRREGNTPIASFSGAERVWAFFKDKQRSQPASTTR